MDPNPFEEFVKNHRPPDFEPLSATPPVAPKAPSERENKPENEIRLDSDYYHMSSSDVWANGCSMVGCLAIFLVVFFLAIVFAI